MMDRRTILGLLMASIPAAACARMAKASQLTIYKSPACGCCGAWVDHVKTSGIKAVVREMEDVTPVATKLGVPDQLRSCHTAEINGYFVEGHVPAPDIKKLIAERPAAIGIAAPGMPTGSPGMEVGDRREGFNTMLIDRNGAARLYVRHNRV